MRQNPRHIDGLGEVAGLYDGVILDLWGVVHDGVKPFADTVATLEELKHSRRIVWLLSNAPRRAWTVVERMAEMGISSSLYDGIITSGEAAWMGLRDQYLARWGKRCYHLGPGRDSSLYEGLDVEIVQKPEEADFVLNSGVEDFSDAAEKYIPVLEACAAKNLPMVCANPDRIVHVGEQLVLCAGTIADIYEKMDGQVTWFGKPHRAVYRLCLEAMGVQKVLAVGDTMTTDIAGAVGMGLDSALVMSGIHRAELSLAPDRQEAFFEAYPYRPNFLLERFCW